MSLIYFFALRMSQEPQRTAAAEQAGVSVCGHIQHATKKRKFKTELFAFMGNSTACVIHHMPKGLSIFQCTSVLLSSFFPFPLL